MPDPLNMSLTNADFLKLDAGVRAAFLGEKARVVHLRAKTRLYKLSSYETKENDWGYLSPWWSVVEPFMEDDLGARGRYLEAKLNGVTMQEMVRFAAAIRIDWNDIEQYQEIVLNQETKGFWGLFAPQPKETPDNGNLDQIAKNQSKRERLDKMGVYVPETLGGIEAWQLFIPNLKKEHCTVSPTIPSHDMAALGLHLSLI